MRLRLLRPRDLALALRGLARRRPAAAEQYLDSHPEHWASLVEADPHDAADILEALEDEAAADLISELDTGAAADIFEEMQTEAAADILEEMHPEAAADILEELHPEDAADIVAELEPEARSDLLDKMADEKADDILELLAYPADSAGGLMGTAPATLPAALGAGEAIEALRRLHEHLEHLSYVYVVDPAHRLLGVVSFRDLVFARPGSALEEVMVPNPVAVRPETDRTEVADLIKRYNLLALPVVDHRGVLLGMITIDDVIEEIEEEASEDIATMVGAGREETPYTPVRRSVRDRLPWLVVNLGTAFLATAVISVFQPVIGRLTVLAAYMPVVASMGGNAGAQSQAVIIRALGVDSIPASRVRRVLLRQVLVGVSNGLGMALISGALALAFSGSLRIGLILCLAVLVNLTIANLAGSGVPLLLHRLRQDPAMASNIIMTTVTDVVGFGGFLAIATLLL
jgi:magnesium transporter